MAPGEFPILFTLGNSNRHDVVLINPGMSIKQIGSQMESLIASSPNCAEAMAKYSKLKGKHEVVEISVRWSGEPREAKLWPSSTLLTDDNSEAVLSLVALHGGKDVLEVVTKQQPNPEENTE